MTYMFLMTQLEYVFSRVSVANGFNDQQSSPVVSVSHSGHQLWSGPRRQHPHDPSIYHSRFLPPLFCLAPSCSCCCFQLLRGEWLKKRLLSAPAFSLYAYTPAGKLEGQGPRPPVSSLFSQLLPICRVELCVELMHQTLFANAFCMSSAPQSLAASAHTLNTLCLFSMVVESE